MIESTFILVGGITCLLLFAMIWALFGEDE